MYKSNASGNTKSKLKEVEKMVVRCISPSGEIMDAEEMARPHPVPDTLRVLLQSIKRRIMETQNQ